MTSRAPRQYVGMVLAIAVHLPLLSLFLSKQAVNEVELRESERPAILWISPAPVIPETQSKLPDEATPRKVVARTNRQSAKPRMAPAPEVVFPAPAPETALFSSESPGLPAQPTPISAGEIMRKAKANIAGISRDLNKEFPERDKTPLSTAQSRLEQRFAEAHAAARPDWYEAAKVEEISNASSGGARIYRVVTAAGSFCVTYPKSGGRPTFATCP